MDTWISAAVCWKIFTWIWRCSAYDKTKKIGGAPISVGPIKHSKYRRRNNWIHMDSHVYLQCIIILCNKVLLSALPFSCIIHIFAQWMHFIPGWAPTFLMSAILANSRTQDSKAISLSLYSRPQKRQPLCLRLNINPAFPGLQQTQIHSVSEHRRTACSWWRLVMNGPHIELLLHVEQFRSQIFSSSLLKVQAWFSTW